DPIPCRGVVELRGIRKVFGGTVALAGVDLDLRAGEVHAWVGENGAGKSTLARVLAGLHGDYSGRICVEGREVRLATPAAARAEGIALVHQELSLVPELSVAENVFLGRALRARWPGLVDFAQMRSRARALLEAFGASVPVDARVAQLGPGERQLVEIAKGLAGEPRVLLLDEPTSSLSARETRELVARVHALRARGTSVVYVSHRLDEVFELADRIRSEEHTSELQSLTNLVCRLLLEKKKKIDDKNAIVLADTIEILLHDNQL